MKKEIGSQLTRLRDKKPLVMNITNFVVMNNTANALLAIGASPMMIHAHSEVQDATKIADSLVINIGTLDEYWAESMYRASETAKKHQKPWILDPVGAGLSPFRNQVIQKLIENKPTVIRGNASEIIAINDTIITAGKGVDSTHKSEDAIRSAQAIYAKTGAIVCVSGEKDYVVAEKIMQIHNGHPLMTKVTGLGCSATAIIAAFLALQTSSFIETVSGTAIFSLAGQLATPKQATLPGTLQVELYNELYTMGERTIEKMIQIDEV